MATTVTAAPGKTDFVKDILQNDPEAKAKAVNQAWQDAGFEGTISPTLVNKTRVKMKLTGNRRGKSKAAARKRPALRKPATATETPGKTSFLKEFLHDNPHGNVAAVNQAWQAAGFTGTISPALVNKTRA